MSAAIEPILDLVSGLDGIPGDFAEIGVFRGDSFVKLLPLALSQRKLCHAIDSFRGMNEPGLWDVGQDGIDHYPCGKFDVGGPHALMDRLKEEGYAPNQYAVHEGYIPLVFCGLAIERLSFCFVDLDHHLPTRDALDWAWKRMSPGGILASHDYYEDGEQILARRAVNEWRAAQSPTIERVAGQVIAFRKGYE